MTNSAKYEVEHDAVADDRQPVLTLVVTLKAVCITSTIVGTITKPQELDKNDLGQERLVLADGRLS